MSQEYTIRDLAEEFDITPRALRFYEEKGLLNPTRNNQVRVYSASDRTRLKLILRGKRLGLTLEESSEIILMYDPESGNQQQITALIERIRQKRQQLQEQQQELKMMLRDLQHAEERCLAALNDAPNT